MSETSRELFDAIERHDTDAVALLLARGIDPNAMPAGIDYPPLHAAIFELDFGGSINTLDLLIRAGADVNRMDRRTDGASPVLAAVLDGQAEAAHRLLVAGADPNTSGRLGDSPLRVSSERDDLATADLLLRHGADSTIDVSGGPSGMHALGHAVSNLSARMVELLLQAGADPTAVDLDGQTARQYLPSRTQENAHAWDAVTALLSRPAKGRVPS